MAMCRLQSTLSIRVYRLLFLGYPCKDHRIRLGIDNRGRSGTVSLDPRTQKIRNTSHEDEQLEEWSEGIAEKDM